MGFFESAGRGGARYGSTASRWLLLDEPTAALDLAHQHQTLRLLRALARDGTPQYLFG